MIKETIESVESAINEVFEYIFNTDKTSFILLIGRGDVIQGLKQDVGTDCVIDYQVDRYHDETREGFYLRYLNRNYKHEGFDYSSDDGIDDLSIEMMIYTHLWDSKYFLKSLLRIASIIKGDGYPWAVDVPDNGKWNFFHNQIIEPLKLKNLKIGDIIEGGYSSDIRNSFAHALYDVNVDNKTIFLRPNRGIKTLSFKEFQQKFLYSVLLMNKLHNALELNHNAVAKKCTSLTDPFVTPDGLKVQIYGIMQKRGNNTFPEMRMVHIKQ